jgi:two-component system sensor histidine kinase/response regulator
VDAVARAHAGARLLLAEDNPLNREVACALLADCALVVDTAENGQEAVMKAEATDYSLILMDVQMPMLDGIEATRRIRRLPRHAATPIIAMTANAFDSDRDACLKAGMNHHLPKPIVPVVLYAALLRWLPAATPSAPREAAASPPTPTPDAAGHAFSSIEGLDPVRGLDHLAGNVATYRRVLRLFAGRGRSDLKQLREALADGERDTARRIAHTIKGIAGTLGAITVEPLAARLEAALRDTGDPANVSALADALDTEYRAVSGSILAGLDSAPVPPDTGSGAATESEPAP